MQELREWITPELTGFARADKAITRLSDLANEIELDYFDPRILQATQNFEKQLNEIKAQKTLNSVHRLSP